MDLPNLTSNNSSSRKTMDNSLQGPDAELDYTPTLLEDIIQDRGQVGLKAILIYTKQG